ncbi:MAG: SHOCT domain-containing protein [Symbiobacteriia bacterium]
MFLVPLLIIGLIIWAFAGSRRGGAYGYHGHGGTYGQGGSDALEVLKMRLAKGEINEEEYRRLRDVLK